MKIVQYSNTPDDTDVGLKDIYEFIYEITRTVEGMGFFLLEEPDHVDEIGDQSLNDEMQLLDKRKLPLDSMFDHMDDIILVLDELGKFVIDFYTSAE